jgi:hypothetical protein
MSAYEYRVIPAPRKGEKAKGLKTPEARMAQAMETRLNAIGKDGWEYMRSDVVPMEERAGLTSKNVSYHTVLIFRRNANFGIVTDETRDFGAHTQNDTDAVAATEDAQPSTDETAGAPNDTVANQDDAQRA